MHLCSILTGEASKQNRTLGLFGAASVREPRQKLTPCVRLPKNPAAASLVDNPGYWIMCDVLLVEDHPEVLDLMQLALELRGYAVWVCATGEDALRFLASSSSCQAVVTDIDLGSGMDGLALVEAARSSRPGLRALLYTGHADLPPGRALGTNERFLEKPFSRLVLFDLLDELGVQPSGANRCGNQGRPRSELRRPATDREPQQADRIRG